MEFYFLSRPVDGEGKPVRGYRRRMRNIWKERYDIDRAGDTNLKVGRGEGGGGGGKFTSEINITARGLGERCKLPKCRVGAKA